MAGLLGYAKQAREARAGGHPRASNPVPRWTRAGATRHQDCVRNQVFWGRSGGELTTFQTGYAGSIPVARSTTLRPRSAAMSARPGPKRV